MKAFLGHSFNEKDKHLVNEITVFLSQHVGIPCMSGEKPKNKYISEKIKRWIDEHDIFIGIFTTDKEIFHPLSFWERITGKRAKQYVPSYTTSSWVIQESGYAIAKKERNIILMVERGIYNFPGLQGDVEIILFTKDKLDEAKIKLMELAQDIQGGIKKVAVEESAKVIREKKDEESKDEVKQREQETKDKQIPYDELFEAHYEKDINKVNEVYQKKIKPKLEALGKKNIPFWDAVIYRWNYYAGDASALTKLEEFAKHSNSYEVYRELASCYEFANQNEEAREVILKCKNLAKKDSERIDCTIKEAFCFVRDKKSDAAIDLLLDEANNILDKELLSQMFDSLIDIAKDMEDDYLYVLFCEKALDINPVNTSIRFNIAYKYSNLGKSDLAVFHYQKLIKIYEDPAGFNNLGVAFEALGLKGRSIDCYENAIERKNTLACANIASRYLKQGFAKLAEKVLNQAEEFHKEGSDVHENVGKAKSELKSLIEDEEKKYAKIMDIASDVSRFKVRHSNAFYIKANEERCIDIEGEWNVNSKWNIPMKVDKRSKTFKGKREIRLEDTVSLVGLALAGMDSSGTKTFKTRIVTVNGNLNNYSGKYSINVTDYKDGATLITGGIEEIYAAEGLFIINGSVTEINVLEENKKGEYLFNNWIRK